MKKGSGSGKSPNVVKVKLTPVEDKIVNAVVAELGMHKQELVRRVFSWFAAQEDLIQKIVVGVAPKGQDARRSLSILVHRMADQYAQASLRPLGPDDDIEDVSDELDPMQVQVPPVVVTEKRLRTGAHGRGQ